MISLGLEPQWSPRGQQIAFETCVVVSGYGSCDGIGVINSDGSGARSLAPRGRTPTWAPNGKAIAFVDEHNRINTTDLHAHVRTLRAGEVPQWSPNGRWIAFLHHQRLEVMRPHGGHPHTIAQPQGIENFAWSPDSRFIAYDAQDLGAIRVVSLRNHRVRTIATAAPSSGDNKICCPDWQPLPR